MITDIYSKYYDLADTDMLFYLFSGKTYAQIAQEYYLFDLNKVLYKVRKLREKLCLRNRRQLVYFALVNGLVDADMISCNL